MMGIAFWLDVCHRGVATLTTTDVCVRDRIQYIHWNQLDMKGISITFP